MRRILLIMVAATIMFVSCSDKPELSPEQYDFFNVMGEKLPYMKPDTSVVLATTDQFNITNLDVMIRIYHTLDVDNQNTLDIVYHSKRGNTDDIDYMTAKKIEQFIVKTVIAKAREDIIINEAKLEGLDVPRSGTNFYIKENLFTPSGGKKAFIAQLTQKNIDFNYVRADALVKMINIDYIDKIILPNIDRRNTEQSLRQLLNDLLQNHEFKLNREVLMLSATPVMIDFFNVMGEKLPYMKPDATVVLATTNKFEITNLDIMENVYQGMRGDVSIMNNVEPSRIEAFLMQVVTLKAQQDILLEEAKRQGLSVSKDSIDAFIEKNLYAPNGGKEAFLEQLELQQVDLDFVREDTRKNMLIMKYIDEIALTDVDINVSEEDIRNYYEENKEQYSLETASVRHILFMTQGKSEEEKIEVKQLTEDVLKRARAGEDFIKLASEYSEDPGSKNSGGLYADFPRGRMGQTFEDASFTLPVGTISDPVETPYGYHIIKIIDHKYGKTIDDVRDEIKRIVSERKKEAAFPPILDELVKSYEFKFTL